MVNVFKAVPLFILFDTDAWPYLALKISILSPGGKISAFSTCPLLISMRPLSQVLECIVLRILSPILVTNALTAIVPVTSRAALKKKKNTIHFTKLFRVLKNKKQNFSLSEWGKIIIYVYTIMMVMTMNYKLMWKVIFSSDKWKKNTTGTSLTLKVMRPENWMCATETYLHPVQKIILSCYYQKQSLSHHILCLNYFPKPTVKNYTYLFSNMCMFAYVYVCKWSNVVTLKFHFIH